MTRLQFPCIDLVIPAFNASGTIAATLNCVLNQEAASVVIGSVFVVDDASTDETASIVQATEDPKVKLIVNPRNIGRSRSRNLGARSVESDYIFFLDSDCQLSGKDALLEFIRDMESGKDLCFGYASSLDDDFWGKYQRRLANRRIGSKEIIQQTSACFLCRRTLFESVGGFSEEYEAYGFEDRDLMIRLADNIEPERISYNSQVLAAHCCPEGLMEVACKIHTAGRCTSGVFLRNFPMEYNELSFSKFDVRSMHSISALALSIIAPFWKSMAKFFDSSVARRPLPFSLKQNYVLIVVSLSYFEGTKQAD